MTNPSPADEIAAEVLASPKYRGVSPDLVLSLAARELAAGRSRKDASKAVKNKLHQVAGAYFEARPDYLRWLAELEAGAAERGAEGLRAACREVMRRHASTRERLPILERFYAECLADVPPPQRVLDMACGLNPLAIPWMPLAPGAAYHACDLYSDLAEFLRGFLRLAHVPGHAEVCDLVRGAPPVEADIALALKLLPVLEQVDRAAPLRLLREVRAPRVLVSFPAQSLGGRGKGMAEQYEARFRALVADEPWQIRRHAFPSEIAFLIEKG